MGFANDVACIIQAIISTAIFASGMTMLASGDVSGAWTAYNYFATSFGLLFSGFGFLSTLAAFEAFFEVSNDE